jgi:hypothetical protein
MRIYKYILAAAALVLLSTSAKAQTQTIVSATITDPNGVPWSGARVSFGLSPTASQPSVTPCPGPVGCQFQLPGPVVTDSTGSFTLGLWPNANILPASTQWTFTVSEPGVPLPWGTGPQQILDYTVTISGATQSLTGALSALAPALTHVVTSVAGVASVTGAADEILCTPTTGNVVCSLLALPPTLQTNGVNNASQTLLNLTNSASNPEGLTLTLTNTGGGAVKGEIGGASYAGNAATATQLAVAPSGCTGGTVATGITATGTGVCTGFPFLTGSVTNNLSVAAGACQGFSITVAGATSSGTMAAFVSPNVPSGGYIGLSWSAQLLGSNTVAVNVCNPTAATVNIGSTTWVAWVI